MSKASNKEVTAFAENMVRDHEAVNKLPLDLVKKLNVTPEDNDTSKTLSKQAAAGASGYAVLGVRGICLARRYQGIGDTIVQ